MMGAVSYRFLMSELEDNTQYYSSLHTFKEQNEYRKLLSMGENIIPLLVLDLKEQPSWMQILLLSDLVKDPPFVFQDLTGVFEDIVSVWLNWAEDKGL